MKQFFGLFFIQAIEFETKLKIIDRKKKKNSTDNKDSEDQKFNIKKSRSRTSQFPFDSFAFSIQFDYHLKRTEPKPIQPNSIKNRIKLNGAQTNGNLVLLYA